MNKLFDEMSNDITFLQYEDAKRRLSKAILDGDKVAANKAKFDVEYRIKQLEKLFTYYIGKDLNRYDGSIAYLFASDEDRKYMNHNGTANNEAINNMCDEIDSKLIKCEVAE